MGYKRVDGRVGTRNFIAVVSTVNCSATVVHEIASYFTEEKLKKYPNVDGVAAFSHSTGCGMELSGEPMDLLHRTLGGYINHPNVASSLVVGLGCERCQVGGLFQNQGLAENKNLKTLVMQENGGTTATIRAGIKCVEEMLENAVKIKRSEEPLSSLMVGLQCGGSDVFSSLSANPALGKAVDILVEHGGTAILSETPEIYGVENSLTARAVNSKVAEKLMKDGYNADALHGDLSQGQRDNVMKKFRNKTISMLIATDVAARGIDVDDVSHVFHYDLPDEIESYTHRSGRTGRAGKFGISIALIAPQKSGKIKLIEKKIGKPLELVKAPSGQDICGMQLLKMIKGVQEVVVNEKEIAPFVAQIHESLSEYSKEELIERFVSVEFNGFLKEYAKSGDINVDPSRVRKGTDERFNDRGRGGRERGERSGSRDGGERRSSRGGETNTKRVFINVGKMDGFENNGQLLGFLCNQSGVDGSSLGKIDLFDSFAFVGVDDGVGEKMISSMNGQNIENRDIRVEFSQDKPQGERGGGDRGGSRGRERRSSVGDKRRSSGSSERRSSGGGDRRRYSGSTESRAGGERNFRERRRRD